MGDETGGADFAVNFPGTEGTFEDLAAYSKQVRSHLIAEGPLSVGPRYREYAYLPLKELIGYLRAQKFQIWIISSGDHEVDRAMAKLGFDVPRDRVIALSELEMKKATTALKHVIWERIGRVPRIFVGRAKNDSALFNLADKGLSTLTVQMSVPAKALNQPVLSTYDLKSDLMNTWDFVLSPKTHWQRTYAWQPVDPVGLTKN
ncbi:HAD family hydrolase [Pseudovibrio sp. Tun.PSC04-5.I4]|uniref:HAD family hydrolase n=1 Tax=Pseudovibrio sp. Tun.PSC04-5.I4 TaxID=1798213 RepID=UPI000B8272F4|nr:HAD family hydrolase [Pseudovibrio sp. Tun.PSC04-5.I4]